MDYKYFVKHNPLGYYIQLQLQINADSKIITSDYGVANFLGILEEEYRNILITKFNGIIKEYYDDISDIFFDKEEDCKKAISYLYKNTNQYLITKELLGG